MGFGNEGGSGGHFGEGGGITPFEGKPGPPSFGGIPGYCNLLITTQLDIRHAASPGPGKAGKVTMQLHITVIKKCLKEAIKEEAFVVIQNNPEGGQNTVKAKKVDTDACKPFDGIENDGLLDPVDIPGLFKDMSDATDEMGKEFSLGNLFKKICEGTGAGHIIVRLLCSKPLGECNLLDPSDCDKEIEVILDLPWPLPNQPFDELFTRPDPFDGTRHPWAAEVDPCKLAKLLACWKEKPKANTSIPIGNQGAIINGLRGKKNPNPPPDRLPVTQEEVDEAGDKTMDILLRLCERTQ